MTDSGASLWSWLNAFPARWISSAPGRVNLIGEHVDYSGGFVLPAAIGLRTRMAAWPRDDDRQIVIETGEGLRTAFAANVLPEPGGEKWTNYLRGVLHGCLRAGLHVPGLEVRIGSALPQGGGLASSAALTVAFAGVLEQAAGQPLTPEHKAVICQEAERFAGVPSGCMDQIAAVHGRAGHAMLIDCRSREIRHLPLGDTALVIIDTGVKHDLADGGYATRHAETVEAARLLGIPELRDASLEATETLPEPLRRRARHVVTENRRTLRFAEAVQHGDWPAAGRLMAESHASLRDDFEVSCPELDRVVDFARTVPGVLGCRMTGGGFGGCCIATVPRDRAEEAARAFANLCGQFPGAASGVLVTSASAGACRE